MFLRLTTCLLRGGAYTSPQYPLYVVSCRITCCARTNQSEKMTSKPFYRHGNRDVTNLFFFSRPSSMRNSNINDLRSLSLLLSREVGTCIVKKYHILLQMIFLFEGLLRYHRLQERPNENDYQKARRDLVTCQVGTVHQNGVYEFGSYRYCTIHTYALFFFGDFTNNCSTSTAHPW